VKDLLLFELPIPIAQNIGNELLRHHTR
jgi:hypothetical protein